MDKIIKETENGLAINRKKNGCLAVIKRADLSDCTLLIGDNTEVEWR